MIPTNPHRRGGNHGQAVQDEDSAMKTYVRFLRGAKTGKDGLTYKESTHPAAAASPLVRALPWGLAVDDDREPDGCGAPSLLYLTRKYINHNLDRLDVDALRATPLDPLGKLIWQDAVATYVAPTICFALPMATEGSRYMRHRPM